MSQTQDTVDALRALLDDPRLPDAVRTQLVAEFAQVEALIGKLERGEVHVALLGRVSVGKSSLGNALIGSPVFATSLLHGHTQKVERAAWAEATVGGVHLLDTPGLDEYGGEVREAQALDAARIADLVLFVSDGDLTEIETSALQRLRSLGRPLILVLNKADRYLDDERAALRERLAQRLPWLQRNQIVLTAADPRPETVIVIDASGREQRQQRARNAELDELKQALATVLAREGLLLAAVSAGMVGAELAEQIAERTVALRADLAQRLIGHYCLAKGLAVGCNPVPVADLAAAMALDVALIVHLSHVLGLPLTHTEAGRLLTAIGGQMALLMGAWWAVHLAASTLKGLTIGLSTVLTGVVQGAVAWYATRVIGEIALAYLKAGKSWGLGGPKRVVSEVLARIDRDSVLAEARAALQARLRAVGGKG